MDQFEEKKFKEFSVIGLFAVTGICFLSFSVLLKLLDGSFSPLFNKIGFISIGLFVVCLVMKWIIPTEKSRQNDDTSFL
ncbi:MAG: hypothetical protein QM764_08025 [Chitinophagaceae bacterium]